MQNNDAPDGAQPIVMVRLAVPRNEKGVWVAEARRRGMRLSDWMRETLNANSSLGGGKDRER